MINVSLSLQTKICFNILIYTIQSIQNVWIFQKCKNKLLFSERKKIAISNIIIPLAQVLVVVMLHLFKLIKWFWW